MTTREPALSELYHENTKMRRYDREEALRSLRISSDPVLQRALLHCFKEYRGNPEVELPEGLPDAKKSLEEIVGERRSIRSFGGANADLSSLASMLWCGSGITGELRDDSGELLRHLRTTPSAGALYPVESYVVSFRMDGLAKGLYHYNVRGHKLEVLEQQDLKPRFSGPHYQEEIFAGAAGVILLTGVFQRTTFKYGDRGYRYVLLEVGHIAQNIMNAASVCGLGTVAICGFVDAEMDQLLDLDGVEESTLYLIAFGPEPS